MKSSQSMTMRQVARVARVSVSTVSKALRNDPTLPEKRCRSIQAIATRLGYRPNPMVATLMAQLHHHRRRSDPHNLAWIDLWPAGQQNPAVLGFTPMLRGARERAEDLGYGIEVYPAGLTALSPERLYRTLSVRGQWGLIIPPVPESATRFALDLRGLTGVTIGTSLHEPVMHRVSPNHFQSCVLALTRLRAMNFCRIGLLLTPAMNDRVEGKWLGAFLACQQKLPKAQWVSPLIIATDATEGLARWLQREKPDALLVAGEFSGRTMTSARNRPAIAWLMETGRHPGLGHLDYRPEQLGRVAVELVVAQIHRNERGSPPLPQTVLVDAGWVDA